MTIPDGWVRATIADTGRYINGLAFKPSDWGRVGRPIIRIQNLTDPTKPFNRTQANVADEAIVRRGDILVSWSATLDAFIWRGEEAVLNQHIFRVKPGQAVTPAFLFHLLRQSIGEMRMSEHLHGSTMKHINRGPFLAHSIGLPPLQEQHRIADKLDRLLEQTSAAKGSLERLPGLLDNLERALFAAAFRGDLTIDWRASHPDAAPAPLRKFDAESKAGRLWGSGASAVRPSRVLPAGWKWTRICELGPNAVQIGPMSMKSSEFTAEGTFVLNVGCVQWGHLDLAKRDHLPERRARDFERYRVQAGDVLFTRSGTVGRIALATQEVSGALITFHLLRIRAALEICRPQVLYLALSGVPEVRAAIDGAAVGATRAGFNTRLLEDLWIPLPPPAEQELLEARLNLALSHVNGIARRVEQATERTCAIEKAVLAKAFRGELVPQDPNEEPASALIDRIRSVRALEPERARRGRRAGEVAGAGAAGTVPAPPPPRGTRSNTESRASSHDALRSGRDLPGDPHGRSTRATQGGTSPVHPRRLTSRSAETPVARGPNGDAAAHEGDETIDLVVAAFQRDQRLNAAAIVGATGLDPVVVRKALQRLVTNGQVRVHGRARGTSYEWIA